MITNVELITELTSESRVRLEWQGAEVVTYHIQYRKTGTEAWTTLANVADTAAGTGRRGFDIEGLDRETSYEFQVDDDSMDWSSSVFGAPLPSPSSGVGISFYLYRIVAGSLAFVSNLPLARDRQWLDEHNEFGGGSFKLHASDPAVVDVSYRDIVFCYLDGVLRYSWQVRKKTKNEVGSSEEEDEWWTFAGPGVNALLQHAGIYPEKNRYELDPLRRNSSEDRRFGYTSDLYHIYALDADEQWLVSDSLARQDAPASPFPNNPVEWPDPAAMWIWPPGAAAGPGLIFFRHRFEVLEIQQQVALFIAGTNEMTLYVDNEEVLRGGGPNGHKETLRVDLTLDQGEHLIAVRLEKLGGIFTSAGGLLLSVYGLILGVANEDSELGENLTRSGIPKVSTWRSLPYPDPEPGYRAGEIMEIILDESDFRGVTSLGPVVREFSRRVGYDGVLNDDVVYASISTGKSYWDMVGILVESACDVRMTPWLGLRLAKQIGEDVSNEVILRPAHNLMELGFEGEMEEMTVALIRYGEGWREQVAAGVGGLRIEGWVSLGDAESIDQVERTMQSIFAWSAHPQQTLTIEVTREPFEPYIHYKVGDWVTALDYDGNWKKQRVLGLAITENSEGHIAVIPELSEVA